MEKAKRIVHKGQSTTEALGKPANSIAATRPSPGRPVHSDRGLASEKLERLCWQRDRGRHAIKNGIAFEVLIATIVGGNRLAILVALAHGPLSVGSIQRLLGAPTPSHVSEELRTLQTVGLVTWDPEGTMHIYRLTHRLRVFREDGAIQLVVIAEAGHWALLHVDEGTGSCRMVAPPTCFLDVSRLEAAMQRTSTTRAPGRRESEKQNRQLKHADPSLRSPSSTRRRRVDR